LRYIELLRSATQSTVFDRGCDESASQLAGRYTDFLLSPAP
jgi:hypothetical protein